MFELDYLEEIGCLALIGAVMVLLFASLGFMTFFFLLVKVVEYL